MILIGQFDSPFVRRVGLALGLYDIAFEHRPWSTFADWQEIVTYNPLVRVPTLVLDNGEVLIESAVILDYLDQRVGPDLAMFPQKGEERYRALKAASLAVGAAEKAVSLFYEKRLHKTDGVSLVWVERCERQIRAALAELESIRQGRHEDFLFGNKIGHADIAVACVLGFLSDAHPGLLDFRRNIPGLAAQSERLEALDLFKRISQPFQAPA